LTVFHLEEHSSADPEFEGLITAATGTRRKLHKCLFPKGGDSDTLGRTMEENQLQTER
jgi:hypothetical protein